MGKILVSCFLTHGVYVNYQLNVDFRGLLKNLPSIEDRRHTDRVTTLARVRLRPCRWPWPRPVPRRTSLQLILKPTTMTVNQYSQTPQ